MTYSKYIISTTIIIILLLWIYFYLYNRSNITRLFIKKNSHLGLGLTSPLRHYGFVNLASLKNYLPIYIFTDFTSDLYDLTQYISYWMPVSILILISLTGFTDSLNKYIGRKRRDNKFMEIHTAKHRRGSNDGRVVDLSFFNASTDVNNPDPDKPTKIVFDKNDPSGSLLPIIFTDPRAQTAEFIRDGVRYIGYTNPYFCTNRGGSGILERVGTDTYLIYVREPNSSVISELNNRGIFVFSGNLPLRSVVHSTRTGGDSYNYANYVYIYANRRDAIGVFNPNDPNILPSSITTF